MTNLRILVRHRVSAARYHIQLWSRRDEWICTGVMDLTRAEWMALANLFRAHDIQIHNERPEV